MEWISVRDSMPGIGKTVLVCFKGDFWTSPMMGEFFIESWRIVDLWGEYNEPYQFVEDNPTHWMPLPEPPKEK